MKINFKPLKKAFTIALLIIGIIGFLMFIVGALLKKEDEELSFQIAMIGIGIYLFMFIIVRIFKLHK